MGMKLGMKLDSDRIGVVFTPRKWAGWLLDRYEVGQKWLEGATILDPTAGQGVFALALLDYARNRGIEITQKLLNQIVLVEKEGVFLKHLQQTVWEEFKLHFPEKNLLVCDVILETPQLKADVLVGNPPWANYTDLPREYQQLVKDHFLLEGIVANKKEVLLGGSRADLSALVLQVALGKLTQTAATACFFLPLSLFFGDDAHKGFRKFQAGSRPFQITSVYEFLPGVVFESIATMYGCAGFKMDATCSFPVSYFRSEHEEWVSYQAVPLQNPTDPWRVESLNAVSQPRIQIQIRPEQKPRQGVNTCGANAIFMFEEKPAFIPDRYLYPLVTKEHWKKDGRKPHKWILLPYDRETKKALSISSLEKETELYQYLLRHRVPLEARKGTLIRSSIAKGTWWSLLGVGLYSFAPYKVIWQAFGSSEFKPLVVSSVEGQPWQGNQAMHTFIPCENQEDAERLCRELSDSPVERLLLEMNGGGRCNWAQPGKVRKILYENDTSDWNHRRHRTL